MALPSQMVRLVSMLAKLPGIGEKTAQRLAFHIIQSPSYYADLSAALIAAGKGVRFCEVCCNLSEEDLCTVCMDARRDRSLICVTESVPDLLAIERTGEYRGLYHVLHGAISPLDGIGPEDLRIEVLIRRLEQGDTQEVILATNPDIEGEATSLYLNNLIRHIGPKVSKIAQGVPMGGDLEYADQVTLGRAVLARRPYS